MNRLSWLLRALCGAGSSYRYTRRPSSRVRLSVNSFESLEILEDRATPSAAALDVAALAAHGSTESELQTWSAELAALPATQTTSTIAAPTTLTGNGGANVVDINGDIQTSLTLSGTASDVFIVNVSGKLTLTNASLGLAGGVTADHVIYNFVGGNAAVSAQQSQINGTLLAPTRTIVVTGGTVNGQLFSDATVTVVKAGSVVNLVPFVPPTTSEASGTISGHVLISDGNGGYVPYFGMFVTLTGTDAHGNAVYLEMTTDETGAYSFTDLAAGAYTIAFASPFAGTATPGTVDGTADGVLVDDFTIESIDLQTDSSTAVNYDFVVSPLS